MNILIMNRKYGNVFGGVEKMSLGLAGELTQKGYSVTVASLDNNNHDSFFNWPNNVKRTQIAIGDADVSSSWRIRLSRLIKIREILKEENINVAIGFQIGTYALLRLSSIFLGVKIIAAERNSPKLFDFISRGSILRWISILALTFADRITVQFDRYKSYYPRWMWKKIHVTPNYVSGPKEISFSRRKKDIFRILFVGRFVYQKNLHVLIEAMSSLPSTFQLWMVGNGPDEDSLKDTVISLNLQNVYFFPATSDLQDFYQKANILCLPSFWEGFPNVVVEGFSYGLPCVGFAKCDGVFDLVVDGKTGVLSQGDFDSKSLTFAIRRAASIDFSPNEIQESIYCYNLDRFIESWEKVIKSA